MAIVSLDLFVRDIKIVHTVFALPFAASALLLLDVDKIGSGVLLLLFLCMVFARSFAMGWNRFADRFIDAENPRTSGRMIPSGQLSSFAGLFWTCTFAVAFVVCCFLLNPLSGFLSFPVLAILALYSYMKRMSWLTHWYLGLCLGLAPVAVGVALTGVVDISLVALGVAVAAWTAGFDVLYAIHDMQFDRKRGLHSCPARFGASRALWLSRCSFLLAIIMFAIVGLNLQLGAFYWLGVATIAFTLVAEHWLIRGVGKGSHLERIGFAFFNLNGFVSLAYFAFLLMDRYFLL